jgi:hypothetical protein
MIHCAHCGNEMGKGEKNSHGICRDCLSLVSPNNPTSIRHREAMRRGAAALERGRLAQLKRLDDYGT